jgi:hypothetical protein
MDMGMGEVMENLHITDTQLVQIPSPQQQQLSAPIPFRPSRTRQGQDYVVSNRTRRRALQNQIELNPKYKGELDNNQIRNAHCSFWDNCSVHVEGFSPYISQKEMLSIAQFARVAGLNRHVPVPPRHYTAAAEFTFFNRADADEFLKRGLEGQISLPGCILTFLWNRNRVCPAVDEECKQSRTLLVEGAEDTISGDQVLSVLEKHLSFNLVDGQEQDIGGGRRQVRMEFSQVSNRFLNDPLPPVL